MPLQPDHIKKFLMEKTSFTKSKNDLLDLMIKRVNKLCFEECQIDRISCTLTPMCSRRFLLKMRIKNGLALNDLPKFCYSVQKNIVFRDFFNKTVVYRPYDGYLYLIDFFDIFYHGDYRKLNKFVSFKNYYEIHKIFDERIYKKNEDFNYVATENYIIIKYGDRLHILFLNENYALCNARTEAIDSLELLLGICDLYRKLYFPDVIVKLVEDKYVEITTIIPKDILDNLKMETGENLEVKTTEYFFRTMADDIDALMEYCGGIHVFVGKYGNLKVKLHIGLETNIISEGSEHEIIRYRDMRLFLNFVYRLYNEFYILWLDTSDIKFRIIHEE